MTKLTNDDLDSRLRLLDPAGAPGKWTLADDPRAQALARRIVATPAEPVVEPVRRVTGRRLAIAGAAVGLAAAVSVVAPKGLGSAPYAWSAKPQALIGTEKAAAERLCLRDTLANKEALAVPGRSPSDLTKLKPVVSEVRGQVSYVVLAAAGLPFHYGCFVLGGEVLGAGGGEGVAVESVRTPRSARLLTGSTIPGPGAGLESLAGLVGDDVVGVELMTAERGAVRATVGGGYFAAWWPLLADDDRSGLNVNGARLTLRDGTVREVTLEDLATGR